MVRAFLDVFLLPLMWLPIPVVAALALTIGAFMLVWIGRLLKWIWDALPIV